MNQLYLNDFFTIMPALVLAMFGCALLVLRFDDPRANPAFVFIAEAIAAIGLYRQSDFVGLAGYQGSTLIDNFGLFISAICVAAAVLAAFGAYRYLELEDESGGEFYALLLFSQCGMYLMAYGTELVTVFIGLELSAVSLYVLTGFLRARPTSNEAAMKYLLLGAFSSGLLLYGFSILYGIAGSTRFATIARALSGRDAADPLVLLALIPLTLGLLFKVAAAPLHMWAPDAYEGAPTPATAFLSTASKTASFAVLIRLLLGPLLPQRSAWEPLILVAALASLTIGNLGAVTQLSVKRLLAYSSIGHVGYILLGLVSGNRTGVEGMLLYLLVYTLMTTGAFLLIAALRHQGEPADRLEDFRGLLYRNPGMALVFIILLLSLAGLPPTAGFMAKYMIFLSLIQTRQYWLAIVAALYVAVALYYYFRIVREMLLPQQESPATIHHSRGWTAAVALCAGLSLGLGIYPEPILQWARGALR
jgi:NADH-quinone oxidoreductase subunit N